MPQKITIQNKSAKEILMDTGRYDLGNEAVPVLASMFNVQKYFNELWSHGGTAMCHTPEHRQRKLIIYSSFRLAAPLNIVDHLSFYYESLVGGSCFDLDGGLAEISTGINRSDDENAIDVIELYAQRSTFKKFIGYFLIKEQSFILSDLTHTGEGARFLAGILDVFVSWGYLTPRKKKKTAKKIAITFGADAELEVLSEDKRVMNLRHSDTSHMPSIQKNVNAKIGLDGAGAQCELRPDPAESPRELVNNLKALFEEMSGDNIHASTIGDVYPLGAHLHIGVGKTYAPPPDLIQLLDYFLGKFFLRFSGKSRRQYRRLGTWSSQPHGFEYRSLPSAWITDPKIVYIVGKIAKNICTRYFEGGAFELTHSRAVREDFRKYAKLTKIQVEYLYKFAREYKTYTYEDNVLAFWKK